MLVAASLLPSIWTVPRGFLSLSSYQEVGRKRKSDGDVFLLPPLEMGRGREGGVKREDTESAARRSSF